jgi:hypothetical protein
MVKGKEGPQGPESNWKPVRKVTQGEWDAGTHTQRRGFSTCSTTITDCRDRMPTMPTPAHGRIRSDYPDDSSSLNAEVHTKLLRR